MRYCHARFRRARGPRRHEKPRRGAIVVLTAFLLIVLMALLALSIDTGYMYTMQTELDRSVDSAALAGAASLVEGVDVANQKVVEYLVRNPVGDGPVTENELGAAMAQFLADHSDDYQVVTGEWNAVTGQLEANEQLPSAVSVRMQYPNLPLFFGRVLGKSHFSIASEAIAMYQPRDIVLVLDFSGSMNDDSELKSIDQFGLDAILQNLQQIYTELDSPVYGGLVFDPQYITVAGAQSQVEYRYRSVHVTSVEPLSRVTLLFNDGTTRAIGGLSETEGTFAGLSNKPIERVWVEAGENPEAEVFDFDSSSINSIVKTALGLDGVDYPYPSGSWYDYINYARTNSTNVNAGFEYKFGYANLINYWLERKPGHSQTPDLWKVSAYPVDAVKDAVDVFMDYITLVDTQDRLGLVVYNGADGEATLESALTPELQTVAAIARERQAAHYHNYTNIGAGMRVAREHLQAAGRQGAFKMIVLMTDGRANWHSGQYDTAAARSHVQSEAAASADLRYPIVTISLGAGADISLMQEVADVTESRHFNVPGGQAVEDYRADLIEVFRDIAANRPMKLVQ